MEHHFTGGSCFSFWPGLLQKEWFKGGRPLNRMQEFLSQQYQLCQKKSQITLWCTVLIKAKQVCWQKWLFCCLKQSGSLTTMCVFWTIFRGGLCGKGDFAGGGGRAYVRGENMQIFPSLHGRTLTKAVPDSPIQAHDRLWSLSHATVVFVPGLPGGALRALPLPGIKQAPVLHAILQFCCKRWQGANLQLLWVNLTLCTCHGKSNKGGSSKSAPILEWNTRRKLIYSLTSGARKGCPSALSPRWNVAPTLPHFL